MTASTLEQSMAKERKNTPVRIDDEAIKWARIASGYTGESVTEYLSRIVAERGRADAELLHAETMKQKEIPESGFTKRSGRTGF